MWEEAMGKIEWEILEPIDLYNNKKGTFKCNITSKF